MPTDHYREAERLADEVDRGDHDERELCTLALRAQVHATLAQTEALVLPLVRNNHRGDPNIAAWAEALGAQPGGEGP